MTTPLHLAAGTVLDASPADQLRAAAAAGFDGCGLRLDPAATDGTTVAHLAATAAREGVQVFDVEVVRLTTPLPTPAHVRLIAVAADLGAPWVLTVSEVEDFDDRRRGIEALAAVGRHHGVGIALEFMAFTAIRDLPAALRMWSLVGAPVAVLVDALHLFRTGGTAAQVAAMPPGSLAYLQLCDAPAGPAPLGPAALADEARHRRRMPGSGVIDLVSLVAAAPPGTPVTVEVQDDDLARREDVATRAALALAAATRFVGRP